MSADPARLALERALALAREQVATLEAALNGSDAPVPLKRAAHEMGLDENAARKRAQRGSGVLLGGRWHFPRWYIDGVKAGRVST